MSYADERNASRAYDKYLKIRDLENKYSYAESRSATRAYEIYCLIKGIENA